MTIQREKKHKQQHSNTQSHSNCTSVTVMTSMATIISVTPFQALRGCGYQMVGWLVLLSFTKINTYLTLKHFVFNEDPNTLPKLLNFWCELAWQMIDKSFLKDAAKNADSKKAMLSQNTHDYAVAPHHAKYFNGRVVILGASYRYQKYKCS